MKKIIVYIYSIIIVFALFGCGKDTPPYSHADYPQNKLSHYDWSQVSLEISKYMNTNNLHSSPYTQVRINRKNIELVMPVMIVNGRLLIPFNNISDEINTSVKRKDSLITLTRGERIIDLEQGKTTATVRNKTDEKQINIELPIVTVEENTLVPLRIVTELGFRVSYDRKKNIIDINSM